MELREVKKVDKKQIIEQKRRRAKKRAVVFAVIFLLVAIIVLGVLSQAVLFPIKNISVSGNTLYTSDMILTQANISENDKLFGIFEKSVNNKLSKRLPYIKNVKIKRVLPDSLSVIVTETAPAYRLNISGNGYLLDRDYKVLEQTSREAENITEIYLESKLLPKVGEYLTTDMREIELVKEVLSILDGYGIEIKKLSITGYDKIAFSIADRFEVDIGTSENLSGKIAHLKGMLAEIDIKNGTECSGNIDLSAWSDSKREGFFDRKK